MLKHLQSHEEFLEKQQTLLALVPSEALAEYREMIEMFQLLNFDPAHDLLAELYSPTGRPALVQIEVLRCFILSAFLNLSWEKMLYRLHRRAVFRAIIGITKEDLPTLPSFYALSRRLMPTSEKTAFRKKLSRKPKKKYKKNEKMPEKKEKRSTKLAKLIRKGPFNLHRPERFLQQLFKRVSLDSSIAAGLLSTEQYVSGDGTCVETGASSYGRKICDCRKIGIFHCDCKRRYSDPQATYGWDSSKEQYFYGYSAYFFSVYNPEKKLDLPIYLRTLEARRHDSLSALVALAEFREVFPEFKMKGFLSDSASDNYETYHLLNEWKIPAFIALNGRAKGNFTYNQVEIDGSGTPICEGGLPMIFNWHDSSRCRNKFRCPAKAKTDCQCPLNTPCSTSSYGRTVYTRTEDNPRFFTAVPRDSRAWCKVMNQRTSVERINKQVLQDCGIENNGVRTRSRITLWLTAAMMVIHLKAQYNYQG